MWRRVEKPGLSFLVGLILLADGAVGSESYWELDGDW